MIDARTDIVLDDFWKLELGLMLSVTMAVNVVPPGGITAVRDFLGPNKTSSPCLVSANIFFVVHAAVKLEKVNRMLKQLLLLFP